MSETVKVKKETSGMMAIFKTVGFFAALFLAGWLFSSLIFSRIPKDVDYDKDYQEISFNQLGGYDWYSPEPNSPVRQDLLEKNQIPAEVKSLNGKKVAVAGFMMPADVDDDGKTSRFAVNGNYDACFYGAPTKINDWVIVNMKEGKKAPFTHQPITVYGSLEVGADNQDGETVSLYRMIPDAVVTDRGTVK